MMLFGQVARTTMATKLANAGYCSPLKNDQLNQNLEEGIGKPFWVVG
jgi:hypothetical protein